MAADNCEMCGYLEYNEELEYYECTMNLDEDEMYEAACNIKKELTSDEFSSYVNLQLAVDYMSLVEGVAQKRLLVLYQDNIKRLVVTDSDQIDEEEFSEISLKEKLNDIG